MASDDYIPIRKAAERLKMSESSIRRLFDRGGLEGHRTPAGHRRILRKSVDALEQTMFNPGITFTP